MTLDPFTDNIWVANYGSDNVTVIHDLNTVASVQVGHGPDGIAFDPVNGLVYVANFCGDPCSSGKLASSSTVSVIQSFRVIASVIVGSGPRAVVCDNITGDVYVANWNSSSISVIKGTSLVATVNTSSGPEGGTFDYQNGYVYITNDLSGQKTILSGLAIVGTVHVGNTPRAASFDSWNGLVYVADSGSLSLTLVNGTQILAYLYVGAGQTALIFDAGNGLEYVSLQGYGTVLVQDSHVVNEPLGYSGWFFCGIYVPSHGLVYLQDVNSNSAYHPLVLSTLLAIGPAFAVAANSPIGAVELPDPIVVNATVWALGTLSNLTIRVATDPSTGISCGAAQIAMQLVEAQVWVQCSPTGVGIYKIWLNLTDRFGFPVSTWTAIQVYPALQVEDLRYVGLSTNPETGFSEVDAGQEVLFVEKAAGGIGPLLYKLNGIAPVDCLNLSSNSSSCWFPNPGTVVISSTVTDLGNGRSIQSRSVTIMIRSDPIVSPPIISPRSVDQGQVVSIDLIVTGGIPPYEYYWFGLPFGCGGHGYELICEPQANGTYHISFSVNDSTGYQVVSATSTLVVRSSGGQQMFLAPADVNFLILGADITAIGAATWLFVKRPKRRSPRQRMTSREPTRQPKTN